MYGISAASLELILSSPLAPELITVDINGQEKL